jgi:hypothetical protein
VSFGSICNINLIFSINEVKKMDLWYVFELLLIKNGTKNKVEIWVMWKGNLTVTYDSN